MCVYVSLSVACRTLCKPHGAPPQLKITFQNEQLGRKKEEGKWAFSGPLQPAYLLPHSSSALPTKPLCHSLDPGEGEGQSEGGGEKACSWVWFLAFPERGPHCACPLVKVTLPVAGSSGIELELQKPSILRHSLWIKASGFLLFPCCLVPPWGRGTMLRL